MTAPRESDIEGYLNARAAAFGSEVRKVRWIGRRGAPDRLIMRPGGLLWWVELKAPGEKVKPHQVREHSRMRKMGQQVFVVDSFEQVDELFSNFRAKKCELR